MVQYWQRRRRPLHEQVQVLVGSLAVIAMSGTGWEHVRRLITHSRSSVILLPLFWTEILSEVLWFIDGVRCSHVHGIRMGKGCYFVPAGRGLSSFCVAIVMYAYTYVRRQPQHPPCPAWYREINWAWVKSKNFQVVHKIRAGDPPHLLTRSYCHIQSAGFWQGFRAGILFLKGKFFLVLGER